MELLGGASILVTLLITACSCLLTLAIFGGTGYLIYRAFGGTFKNMAANRNLMQTGVSAPATIISVEDTGVTMNDNPQARLTLQVTPAGRAPFQATATTFVGRFQVGMLIPGASVSVRYDPNDISKVAVESIGAPSSIQSAMQAQDQYFEQLRRTGEEAEAVILAAQDMGMRVEGGGSMFRLKFEVTSRFDGKFVAETQAAIADVSREKYSVGKKVYVRYDPANKAQVALDRAA